MNKKLMAVAVAGALAAPVAMAQSNVTISGRMALGVDTYSATGATQAASSGLQSRNRVWDNGSRVTIAGAEDANGMGTQRVREAHAKVTMHPSDRERHFMLRFIH